MIEIEVRGICDLAHDLGSTIHYLGNVVEFLEGVGSLVHFLPDDLDYSIVVDEAAKEMTILCENVDARREAARAINCLDFSSSTVDGKTTYFVPPDLVSDYVVERIVLGVKDA